jgi:glycosyltransferase involved in cell wall biosynthesis
MSLAERASAPSVSVIVPCFNQARFLPAALTSVLEQSFDGEVECIVVDDGSTDATEDVARRYRVTLLAQENRGLAAARNRGLDAAGADLVVFLDADDRLAPCALSVNAAALAARPKAGFVSGHCTLVGPDGTRLYTPSQYVVDERHYDALLAGSYIWNPGSVMYRKARLIEIGGFEPTLSPAADYDVYLRLARSDAVVAHAQVTVEYRQHAAQMSHRSEPMLTAIGRILARELEDWHDEPACQEMIRRTRKSYEIYYAGPLVVAARSVLVRLLARAEELPGECNAEDHARAYAEITRWHRSVLESFSVSRTLALDGREERERLEQRCQELWHEVETAC